MLIRVVGNVMIFVKKCKKDKINAYSAQSAFFVILSAIPFLIVFSSLLRYTPITESALMQVFQKTLPEYISPFLISITEEVYNRSIGVTSITAVIAIWSASKGIHYMTAGLNAVNDLEENRNWLVLRFWAIIYTLIFLFAIIFTLLVLVFGNSLHILATQYIPLLSGLVAILANFKGVLIFALLVVFFDVIFTKLPSKRLEFKGQLPGAVLCAGAWYVFSFGLSIYVDYFNGFSMYGSLTTIVLIMLWLYFCMYLMMICAEINVVFNEHFRRWLKRERRY